MDTSASTPTTAASAMVSDIDPSFEHYIREIPGLTYASDDQSWIARGITRSLERALGRHKIERHYFALKRRGLDSQSFFQQALAVSGVSLNCDFSPLDRLRDDQPTLFLANHPFGVMDGLILCNIAMRIHGDFRVVINSLLCQDRQLAKHFLPIDFSGTREAERRNVRAKQMAGAALKGNIPLVLFPSGMVSTAGHMGFGKVQDAPWTTFAAKLVRQHQPQVVPVYFHGRNSRPFHVASHIAEPLRMAMLMHESLRRFDKPVDLVIGEPLQPESWQHIEGRQPLTQFLYNAVQALGRSQDRR